MLDDESGLKPTINGMSKGPYYRIQPIATRVQKSLEKFTRIQFFLRHSANVAAIAISKN